MHTSLELSIGAKVKLNNGAEIPLLGLGTWQMNGDEAIRAVDYALDIGYRLIDTASMYRNEEEIGRAVYESGIAREEIFLTTKVWPGEQGYEETIQACERSLQRLGMDYVDLYLIHWPSARQRKRTWAAMEQLNREGKARSVGVSNYGIEYLEEILTEFSIPPSVNQVEFSPYDYREELLDFCRHHGIQLEAYSPLTRGSRLGDDELVELAKKDGKTPAQVLIRWALQKGVVVIPKSSHRSRIEENSQVFDFSLSQRDMSLLDSFSQF